jgi:hypothetical protein
VTRQPVRPHAIATGERGRVPAGGRYQPVNRSRAAAEISGPTSVLSSAGSPARSDRSTSMARSRKRSNTGRSTNSRVHAMHICPVVMTDARAAVSAVRSNVAASESANTACWPYRRVEQRTRHVRGRSRTDRRAHGRRTREGDRPDQRVRHQRLAHPAATDERDDVHVDDRFVLQCQRLLRDLRRLRRRLRCPPFSFSAGSAARMTCHVPRTLTRSAVSQSSAVSSSSARFTPSALYIAALLITASSRPNRSTASRAAASISESDVISQRWNTSLPGPRTFLATCAPSARSRGPPQWRPLAQRVHVCHADVTGAAVSSTTLPARFDAVTASPSPARRRAPPRGPCFRGSQD